MVNGLTADGIQPCTINGYLGSLHTVLKYAVKLGIAPVDFMDKDLMPRLRQTERVHQNVTDTLDYDAILNTVETARDRALLALLGVASMRKGEVIALNVEDIFPHEGGYKLLIRQAKAQAQRWAILPEAYADALREHLKSVQSGAVFTARKTGKRLNSRSVNWIVNQYAEYSPHKYRHAGAERLYAAGASTEDIASILGNTISTCERVYRGVNLDRMTATANLLKPAY
jgi:integrase